MSMTVIHSIAFLFLTAVSCEVSNYSFPENFQFGVATASYQIEGGWNEGGRSESIWDYNLHQNPNLTDDKSNGDIACDSYHKWKEDIEIVKNLGVDFYRLSISWSRILPSALKGSELSTEGVIYYNNIIDELIANNIVPYVTIFHWDTPQVLEFKGGWLNETVIEDYIYYARILFELYGDRVKHWITFNEPHQICEQGYATAEKAPFKTLQGTGDYLCYHHVAIAHGKIYRIYEEEYKPTQKGQVGITIDCVFGAPKTDTEEDKQAAIDYMEFQYGWFAHPILSGNYPPLMIEKIGELSRREGFPKSRLPEFTQDEIKIINGSFDFLGLNHYTTVLCSYGGNYPVPSHRNDLGTIDSIDPSWKPSAADWLWEVPWGLRGLLVYIKDHYNNPPVLITENGWANRGRYIHDVDRINYMKGYLSEVLKAIYDDGCNVIGYTAWSLLDNFEWTYGYTMKFGLVYVDFESENRTRTPRDSYEIYKKIVATKSLQIY
ncbi:myrosinase 1-like [Coccinella septempunctata]|uniref:myrosinase 1-like n=1 Tax=Coccinella septempunctata TaxID=41139 RepID=UPI001D071588|nr:myrosinase 1-like [Coccinella septempunctata]